MRKRISLPGSVASVAVVLAMFSASPTRAQDQLHDDFESLLARYVTQDGVRYAGWASDAEDLNRLRAYVDRLETVAVSSLERQERLAYWINLYNAVTLELVLDHYPVESIKDTAGLLKSPWNKKLVEIDGQELSLNQIENEIIRPRFEDARIHFALNCASIGCPPLLAEPYRAKILEKQLEQVTHQTLNDERWVRRAGSQWFLSKIFDWYEEDFVAEAGSVVSYLARYRDETVLDQDPGSIRIEHMDYDWKLNQAR